MYAVIWEAQYEGQRTLGIYTTLAAAKAALNNFLGDDSDKTIENHSVRELALNQPADWDYTEL